MLHRRAALTAALSVVVASVVQAQGHVTVGAIVCGGRAAVPVMLVLVMVVVARAVTARRSGLDDRPAHEQADEEHEKCASHWQQCSQ